MKTAHKIALASLASRVLRGGRSLLGLPNTVSVTRSGLRYRLDLSEGVDFAIYLFGQFERTTAAACGRHIKPGDTVLDIGANIGAHTLNLARLVGESGRVIAFEPTIWAAEKLRANLALNPELAARITLIPDFLGATDGAAPEKTVYSSWPLNSDTAVHPKHRGRAHEIGGPMRSLDSVLPELGVARVDFIKMDVDGYECGIFQGAQKTLHSDTPTIIMELAPYLLVERGTSLSALLDSLRSHSYGLYRETDETPVSLSDTPIPDGASINVIAMAPSPR